MSKPRFELYCRREADLETLRVLLASFEQAGEAVMLTAAPGIAAECGVEAGPLECGVRVVVADARQPAPVEPPCERLAMIRDEVGCNDDALCAELARADLVLVAGQVDAEQLLASGVRSAEACGIARLDPLRKDAAGVRVRAREFLSVRDDARLVLYAPRSTRALGDGLRRLARTELVLAILPRDWPEEWVEAHRCLAASVPGFVLLDSSPKSVALAACDVVLTDDAGLACEAASLGCGVVAIGQPALPRIRHRVSRPEELEGATRAAVAELGLGPDSTWVDEFLTAGAAAPRLIAAMQELLPEAATPPSRVAGPAPETVVVSSEEELFGEIEAKMAFGEVEAARAQIEAHMAAGPTTRGLRLLASVRRRADDLGAAEDALARSESLCQRDLAETLCERARLYLDRGENEPARQAFERARELSPDLADPCIGLGSLALNRADADAAEPFFLEALEREKSARAWSGLGLSLAAQGRARESFEPFETALDLDPGCLAAVFGIVKAAFDTGELATAERRVAGFVELHPANLDLAFTLAGLRQQLGDSEGAREMIDRIELFDSDYPGLDELRAKVQVA